MELLGIKYSCFPARQWGNDPYQQGRVSGRKRYWPMSCWILSMHVPIMRKVKVI